MKKFDRSVRRHHVARLKHVRKRYWAYAWDGTPQDHDPARLGTLVDTACQCSCWICGHRRRWHGLPTNERRRLAACHDHLHDVTRPATAADA